MRYSQRGRLRPRNGAIRGKLSATWRRERKGQTCSTRASRMSHAAILGQSGDEESASFSRTEASDSGRSQAKSRLSAGSVAGCGMATESSLPSREPVVNQRLGALVGVRDYATSRDRSTIHHVGAHGQCAAKASPARMGTGVFFPCQWLERFGRPAAVR